LADNELELKKLGHKITRMQTDATDAKKKVETLAAENEWIEAEKHLFGKPYTDYDFKQLSTKQAQTKLTGLKNEQEQLGKKNQ